MDKNKRSFHHAGRRIIALLAVFCVLFAGMPTFAEEGTGTAETGAEMETVNDTPTSNTEEAGNVANTANEAITEDNGETTGDAATVTTEDGSSADAEENTGSTEEEKGNGDAATETAITGTTEETQEDAEPLSFTQVLNDEKLTVTAEAESGTLPRDVVLRVDKITEEDAGDNVEDANSTEESKSASNPSYTEISDQLTKVAAGKKRTVTGFLAYDISFVKTDETGEIVKDAEGQAITVEPGAPVKVSMKWEKGTAPDGVSSDDLSSSTVSVLHLKENEAGAIEEAVELTADDNTDENNKAVVTTDEKNNVTSIDITVDTFSAFAITWTKEAAEVVKATVKSAAKPRRAAPADVPKALDVKDYITAADISYVYNGTTYIISESTVIPDTVTAFSVTVKFENVKSLDLYNLHDSTLYYDIPTALTYASISDTDVKDTNGNNIGTIKVENNQVVIAFDKSHLSGSNENSTSSGEFTFQCSVDRENNADNPLTITFGNVTKKLTFQEREIAETGTLNITKSEPTYYAGDDAANEGYLEYTLTVGTGEDAMPDVKVEDSITNGASYVEGYLFDGTLLDSEGNAISETITKNGATTLTAGSKASVSSTKVIGGTTSTSSDTVSADSKTKITWTLGDMAANETRTLTYRIKLKQNYVGLYNRTALTNTAKPYAKTYQHGQATSSFTPHEAAAVTKTAGDIVDSKEGTGTITIPYTVEIKADATNTWPIRNVKIADNLFNSYGYQTVNGRIQDTTATQNDRKAMCANAKFQNFRVYQVDANGTKTELTIPTITGKTNPDIQYATNNLYNPRFDLYAGDVEPNTTLVVTYNLVIDKTLFTTRSGSWNVKNNVTVRTDDSQSTTDGGNTSVGSGTSNKTVGTQVWDRKVMGEQLTAEVTQTPSDGKDAKTIPVGAIKYQVVVNETGQWNVSEATLTDTLGDHLQYTGYLQVDYYATGISYTTSADGSVTLPSDADAISSLQNLTKTSTTYIDIDTIDNETHSSFTFTPKDQGLTTTSGAYLLTYYAVPTGTESMSTFNATNNFSVSGTVYGPGSTTGITAGATTVSQSRVLSGGANFNATKRAWFYDEVSNNAYWVIEVSGNAIPAELAFKDVTVKNCSSPQLIGAYIGTIDNSVSSGRHLDEVYKNYRDFQSTLSSLSLTALTAGESNDYTWESNIFTVKKAQTLSENQRLYIIITTTRSISGSDKRTTYDLQNKIQKKESGETEFRDVNTATLYVKGGGDIFKELGEVVRLDSSGKWTQVTSGRTNSSQVTSNLVTDKITAAGTYIEWRVKMNMNPNLTGIYDVEDTLPDGVTPVYVWYFWINTSTNTADNAPEMLEISDLGSSWTDIGLKNIGIVNSTSSGTMHNAYAYYNSSDRKIKFKVNFKQSWVPQSSYTTSMSDSKSLELSIVAKVDDSAFMASSSNSYINSVLMTDSTGAEVGNDSVSTSISLNTLTKSSAVTSNNNLTVEGRVPFTITINPLGEDLVPGSDTLTVVDEMSDPLAMDLTTLKVTNTAGTDITSRITVQGGGRTSDDTGNVWRFVVPDNQVITITYNAIPYVELNKSFTVKNTAYWEGVSGGVQPSVNTTATNQASAIITTEHPPAITVTKRDASQVATVLSGAVFSLTEVTWDSSNEQWVTAEGATTQTATTAAEDDTTTGAERGKATFSNLKFDTVYKLEETTAPTGYQKDFETKYIVVAKVSGTRQNPTFDSKIAEYASHGATIQYTGAWQFSIDASDTPNTYELPSTGGPGINILRTIGALLTGFSSLLLVSWVYRRREE